MDNGEAMPDKGDNRQLTVDYLTTLEIRGEIILVSRKKNKNFLSLDWTCIYWGSQRFGVFENGRKSEARF